MNNGSLVEVALPLPLRNSFTYRIPENQTVSVGQRVLVPFRSRMMKGIVVEPSAKPEPADYAVKDIHSVLTSYPVATPEVLKVSRWVADKYGCSWGEALELFYPPFRRPKRMMRMVEPAVLPPVLPDAPLSLTEEQKAALAPVLQSIDSHAYRTFLLFGVTSSGKTEIYMKAIERALHHGRQAIFLVPEIALCLPFHDLLVKRFGKKVGIWHSLVHTKSRIYDQILTGDIQIVIGARSAMFVPFQNLGVIVMDEEHDHSYKQDEKPRYQAREVAEKIAQVHNAALILGSATPSVESFHRAQAGRYELLEMKMRVPTHQIPQVTLVDQRARSRKASPLSEPLVDAVNQAVSRREQVILALNRRGFSTFVLCANCRHVWKCSNCDLALVVHREIEDDQPQESLQCHYCFLKKKIPTQCEKCQSPNILMGGHGTQRITQEIKTIFPFARTLRMDKDVIRKKTASMETYRAFKDEAADILVGTQMVTQGFDFPRVTLVGIVDADTSLFHPDFRSSERTFQWISQASGRAGRSSMGGRVLVQTAMPEHYALQAAAAHDYRSFYDQEIRFRKELGYPPFASLVLLGVQSSKNKTAVPAEADRLAEFLKKRFSESGLELAAPTAGIQILGPGPAPREHLRSQVRWQILVKCKNENLASQVVRAAETFDPKSNIRIVIDADPYDLL